MSHNRYLLLPSQGRFPTNQALAPETIHFAHMMEISRDDLPFSVTIYSKVPNIGSLPDFWDEKWIRYQRIERATAQATVVVDDQHCRCRLNLYKGLKWN
ncbi:MAG: hypothetical protein WCF23_04075 [Candidatus Nitrosopolaris sp.]